MADRMCQWHAPVLSQVCTPPPGDWAPTCEVPCSSAPHLLHGVPLGVTVRLFNPYSYAIGCCPDCHTLCLHCLYCHTASHECQYCLASVCAMMLYVLVWQYVITCHNLAGLQPSTAQHDDQTANIQQIHHLAQQVISPQKGTNRGFV